MKKIFFSTAIILVIAFLTEYLLCIPYNIHSMSAWTFWGLVILAIGGINVMLDESGESKYGMIVCGMGAGVLALLVILGIASTPMFHARRYASLANVTTVSLNAVPDVQSNLPLMDTKSAEVIGNKELGSLTELVGQFDDDNYRQINYKGDVTVVAPLRYNNIFKWNKQKYNGVPGYIHVDTQKQSADYVALAGGMKIIPSAYFGDDLERYLWKAFPTRIWRNVHFELTEENEPMMVAPFIRRDIGLFGGTVINGVVIVDPVTGKLTEYTLDNVPEWVDIIWDGDLIESLYTYYGSYRNGFWNSVFGQVGCYKTTNNFGYLADKNDVYIFTGVTSLVDRDRSNIGFLIANERTGKMQFVTAAGSDESSAMEAAQGEIQEKGYIASFPSLALLDGKIVYVMVLTDNSSYVKCFGIVDATQVNNVVVASTKSEAIKKFQKLLGSTATADSEGTAEIQEILANNINLYTQDGSVIVEITDADGIVTRYRTEN